eukprot:14177100-Alexandrium_andersonii.AAC.1
MADDGWGCLAMAGDIWRWRLPQGHRVKVMVGWVALDDTPEITLVARLLRVCAPLIEDAGEELVQRCVNRTSGCCLGQLVREALPELNARSILDNIVGLVKHIVGALLPVRGCFGRGVVRQPG